MWFSVYSEAIISDFIMLFEMKSIMKKLLKLDKLDTIEAFIPKKGRNLFVVR